MIQTIAVTYCREQQRMVKIKNYIMPSAVSNFVHAGICEKNRYSSDDYQRQYGKL